MSTNNEIEYDVLLDVIEAKCPMPLLKTKQTLAGMESSQILCVLSSDAGSLKDIPYYLSVVGIPLISKKEENSIYQFLIQKP